MAVQHGHSAGKHRGARRQRLDEFVRDDPVAAGHEAGKMILEVRRQDVQRKRLAARIDPECAARRREAPQDDGRIQRDRGQRIDNQYLKTIDK